MKMSKAVALIFCVLFAVNLFAIEEKAASSDPVYLQLRNLSVNDSVTVSNLVLKRDIGTFTFKSGTVYFAAPVEGRITGAVFIGDGTLSVAPVLESEKHSLSYLTKNQPMLENFSEAVLRFTDGTAEELKKAGSQASAGDTQRAAKLLSHNIERLREDHVSRYNLSARILQDLLSNSKGLFFAFIEGKNYSSREVFAVDPQGVRMFGMEPEEVVFGIVNENKFGMYVSEHFASEYAAGKASGTQENAPIDLLNENLDVDIAKNGELKSVATVTFSALHPNVRVAPFTLFRSLKIDSVTDANGKALPFILEEVSWNENDTSEDDNFNVVLPKPLQKGESFTFKVVYGGKHAVLNLGENNYYPVARSDWYPSTRTGDFAEFAMTFRIPKGLKITATGMPVKETVQDKVLVSEWKSEGPIPNAGFNFGRFKSMEAKSANGVAIVSLANENPPDWVRGILNRDAVPSYNGLHQTDDYALGTLDTTGMMKKPLAEAQVSVQLYSDFYGPSRFRRIAMTQQTACTYGQSWPQLVWMPICAFFDSTVQHQFGLDDTREQYWKVVGAHEVAHQWFGNTVGWSSYRDQWMSEGFANASAAMFLQSVYPDPELFRGFYKSLQEELTFKNRFGYRPIDIGPLTMGQRVGNEKVGWGNYRALAYGKGAYVLHMIRMLLWDPQTKDERFKAMMRDFVKTYYGKPASTEDFKAIVEKHMIPEIDLDGNHKMDWFFNEYVYGTEVPKYDLTSNVGSDGNGVYVDIKLTQSGVSDNFKMVVPIYLELANKRVIRLTTGGMRGNNTIQTRLPLGKMSEPPKRALVNYYYDILAQ